MSIVHRKLKTGRADGGGSQPPAPPAAASRVPPPAPAPATRDTAASGRIRQTEQRIRDGIRRMEEEIARARQHAGELEAALARKTEEVDALRREFRAREEAFLEEIRTWRERAQAAQIAHAAPSAHARAGAGEGSGVAPGSPSLLRLARDAGRAPPGGARLRPG